MTSVFALGLKKSPTRAERRRLTFAALTAADFTAGGVSLTSSATTAGTSAVADSLKKH